MIEQLLELLSLDNYYGKSEIIDFAKGKYKIPETLKESYEQSKRVKNGN
tara:strand:+ start:219 stop:365 length:147 start_codon:yes stop_codon:yes gene_type:complete